MDIDTFRELCLSFPHATEKLQWEEELCFKVGAKIFAMIALGAVPAGGSVQMQSRIIR